MQSIKKTTSSTMDVTANAARNARINFITNASAGETDVIFQVSSFGLDLRLA